MLFRSVAQDDVQAILFHRSVILKLAELEGAEADLEMLFRKAMLSHFMASSPMFRELPSEVIHVFTNEGTLESFPVRARITEQGSLDKCFYLVVHGAVDVFMNGKKVRELRQGEFFGEIALISDLPRTATVFASRDCMVLKISSDAFWRVLADNIQLSLFIENVFEARVREIGLFRG